MDNITNLGFREVMYGYACENTALSPTTVKVWIPEISPDVSMSTPVDSISKLSASIFVNAVLPIVSGSVSTANYIKLPIMHSVLYKDKTIKKGTQLVILFVNRNPSHGYVLGK